MLVALGGTSSDDGTTATLAVQSGSVAGVKLEGAQLAKYQQCAIAGTIGAGFHAEVLAAAASCVLASGDVPAVGDARVTPNDVTVALVAPDVKPIDALLGSWGALFDATADVAGIAVVWGFSENRLVTRYFDSDGETLMEYADLVVTADAIVDLRLSGYRVCIEGSCNGSSGEQLTEQTKLIRETLPWSYIVTGDVLTVQDVLFEAVIELRRGYEPDPPVSPPPARNEPPVVAQPVADMKLVLGDTDTELLNLSNVFLDPEGDDLIFTAKSSNPAAVGVRVRGGELTLVALNVGSSEITVTASDGMGGNDRVSTSFQVVVTFTDPRLPKAVIVGAPTGTSAVTNVRAEVTGAGVTHYREAIVGGAVCSANRDHYQPEKPVGNGIRWDISGRPDGPVTLCVLGRDGAGRWQAEATKASWIKDEPIHWDFPIPDRNYNVGNAIPAWTLPAAAEGKEPVKYSLTPVVPGLSFDAGTRTLTGTPKTEGEYRMTYTATEAGGESVSVTFVVKVGPPGPVAPLPKAVIIGAPTGRSGATFLWLRAAGTGVTRFRHQLVTGSIHVPQHCD